MADEPKPSMSSAPTGRTGGARTRGGRLPPIMGRGSSSGSGTKKTFVPTIPQRRIKKENIQCTENEFSSTPKRDFQYRGRGRGRGRREYISVSGGLFSEGLSGSVKKESGDTSYRMETQVSKPTFKSHKKRTKKEIEEEERKLQEEDDDDFESDDEEGDLPSVLPFKTLLQALSKQAAKIKSEEKAQIKTEGGLNSGAIKTETVVKTEGSSELSDVKRVNTDDGLRNIFYNNNEDVEELLLIQFPASVSLENKEVSADASTGKASMSSQSQGSSKIIEEKETSANLNDTEEGFIGKLQLMKSGDIRFICGSTIMHIEHSKVQFQEDLILMTETVDSKPEMVALGNIGKHIVISPIIENGIKT